VLAADGVDLVNLTSGDLTPDLTRAHATAYLRLRELARTQLDSGLHPILGKLSSPPGGYDFYMGKGGVIAQAIRENQATFQQNSGEIQRMEVPADPAGPDGEVIFKGWDQENYLNAEE
jgi:hypothetical protein